MNEEFGLLLPVPSEHIKSGLINIETCGEAAFGSDMFEFFETLGGQEIKVILYPSHVREGEKRVMYEAIFTGSCRSADMSLKEINAKRPSTALGADGEWAVFWTVKELAENKDLRLSKVKLVNGKSLRGLPRKPLKISMDSFFK